MAFHHIKLLLFCLCATVLVGVSTYAVARENQKLFLRIGIFNSQEEAQLFFEAFPENFKKYIGHDQLWVNAYKTSSGLIERHLEIVDLAPKQSKNLCFYIKNKNMQCIVSSKPTVPLSSVTQKRISDASASLVVLPSMLSPLGMRLHAAAVDSESLDFTLSKQNVLGDHVEEGFSLEPQILDSPEATAAKAAYESARGAFLSALQNVGEGVNEGDGAQAAQENLIALGHVAFEAAGSAYLSEVLGSNTREANILSSDTSAGKAFVHHVKKNLQGSARENVQSLISNLLSSVGTKEGVQRNALAQATDVLMISSASGVIDAGLAAARRSDLYALRNIELEYNLNNFENSYFSFLTTQPVYQSTNLRHNIFLQGGGILNEQSVDIDDDTARHTLNLGASYRYLTGDEKYLLGGNIFFDHQWPYNHSRMSVGVDAKAKNLNLAANYYIPISDYRDSRRDANGVEYEERVLEGYDFELGYTLSSLPELSIFGKGYQYFRETDDDLLGFELSGEYNIYDNLMVKGSFVEENGGRDGVEFTLQYRVPLYDINKPNLVLARMDSAEDRAFMRSKIFEKVRRENRIRVEERVKATGATIITAQFNVLSAGLPFDVGGAATAALVNLPFNTAITVPNGSFGIINFSNGAIANISASGAGDVILEFNATTLTVTATNGGFVQFISGSGGISVVNVPGGTVNLLGTDIDVTDNGVITTIQVRAGAISVVPAVGVAILGGVQADIVSLTIATGATSLLVNPALETRQELAFTNLDLANPDPPGIEKAAPFINVLPVLITGPQFIGNNADLRLTFTQPVTIGGMPQITGFIDANPRNFIYNVAASTSMQVVFRHVYIAADAGAAGITAQALDLNGGTIIGTTNGLNAITAFTNTVLAITDQTAPMLTSSTPVDNEPAFSSAMNIVLNFDEAVQANVGNIVLTDTTDGSDTRIIPIGDAQVSIVGSAITINPTGILDLSTDYTLTIGANIIQDSAGNAFAGIASGILNFTTSNDITPPVLTGTAPVDNASSVAVGSNLVLTFDEDVQAIAGNIVITDTTDGSDTRTIPIGDAQISIVTNTITINPTTDLDVGTAYDVTMAGSVIEDLIGNDFGGITTGNFNFTTPPITSLAQVVGLPTGDYIVNANAQTFTGHIETALGSSWLLVGRGREGWEFDSNGQGTNAAVSSNLGVVAGFTPAAYENAIVNDLITTAAIDLTDIEIRIDRAADIAGTNYQDVLWRPSVQTVWVWDFQGVNYAIVHDVQASILGAGSLSNRATRDANPVNDYRRIFTWGWGNHASKKGFSYGSAVSGVNNNDPNTFLWENTTENHAIPYAEVYIRVK